MRHCQRRTELPSEAARELKRETWGKTLGKTLAGLEVLSYPKHPELTQEPSSAVLASSQCAGSILGSSFFFPARVRRVSALVRSPALALFWFAASTRSPRPWRRCPRRRDLGRLHDRQHRSPRQTNSGSMPECCSKLTPTSLRSSRPCTVPDKLGFDAGMLLENRIRLKLLRPPNFA